MKLKMDSLIKQTNNLSVLIVDDMAKNIQLAAKFLTHEGYNLFFAQSGEAAMKQVNNRPFDLILLDVMMPVMDGFEVCRRIKENENTKNIPIIFLTARTDDEAIKKGFTFGGVDYITKPFNPVELIARVKTHIKLRLREKELNDLNATKDTLLSIISHDLKTPFFNIMALGELILSGFNEYDDAMKKELISNMVESSRISHNLLDNLLKWVRVQTGKIKHNPEEISLESSFNEVIQLLQTPLKSKDLIFTLDVPHDMIVCADVNMLQTIFRNLITNAIKYSHRGGKISVIVKRQEETAVIEVTDTGIGVSAEKKEKMFYPSTNSSTPGTENEPGSGFGLILVREFVEQNKGTISVESMPGEGTTFRFTLPVSCGKSDS
jgi:two-component system, sensor histidine kinase and response regulator